MTGPLLAVSAAPLAGALVAAGPVTAGAVLLLLSLGILAPGVALLVRGLRKGLVQKELLHIFGAPLAWLTLAIFAFVNGFVFLFLFDGYQGRPNEPLVRVFFSEANLFFWVLQLIAIPAITMRLIAEERARGTLELLLTAPVTDGEVVVAKFSAALAFYATLWVPAGIYLSAAFHFAAPDGFWSEVWATGGLRARWDLLNGVMDLGPALTGYFGTVLMGAAWIAIGLCISALCRRQVSAFLCSFCALLTLFAVGFLEGLLRGPGLETARQVVRFVSFPLAFQGFPRGIVDSRPLVYFLTLTALGVFLAIRALESRRWR